MAWEYREEHMSNTKQVRKNITDLFLVIWEWKQYCLSIFVFLLYYVIGDNFFWWEWERKWYCQVSQRLKLLLQSIVRRWDKQKDAAAFKGIVPCTFLVCGYEFMMKLICVNISQTPL